MFTYQAIIAIGGNRNFKGIQLEAMWEMMESCIISIVIYSMDACNPIKAELKNANGIMEHIITWILMASPTTPMEQLYIEMDLLDMEGQLYKQTRINYPNRVAKTKKDILGKITKPHDTIHPT